MTTEPEAAPEPEAERPSRAVPGPWRRIAAVLAVALAVVTVAFMLALRGRETPASEAKKAPPSESPAQARLEVHVIDSEGNAVPDARLEVLGERQHRPLATDGSGVATLAALPGPVLVQVDHPGFGRAVAQIELTTSAPQSLRVTLEPERVLEGTVLDDQQRPLAGAHVRVDSADSPDMTPWDVETDAEGKFRADGLPRHTLEVEASQPGHETVERTLLAQDPTTLSFVLARQGELLVRVRGADGAAVANGVVMLTGPGLWPAAQAHTSGAGEHLFTGLTSGPYRARGYKDADVALAAEPASVVPGARAEVVLTLAPGARACGTLLDASTKAKLGDVRVSVQDLTPGLPPRTAMTDAEGRYDIAGLWPGPARLEIVDPRFAPKALERTLPMGGCETLALEGAARVSGVVVDEQGRPVPRALISVSTREGLPVVLDAPSLGGLTSVGELGVTKGPVPRIPVAASASFAVGALAAETDEEGTFQIAGLAPEPLVLSVARAGFAPRMIELSGLVPHGEKSDLRVVLPQAGRIDGRITDARGEGVSGVYVAARNREGIEQSAVTNTQGEFTIADVLGSITVQATPTGYTTMSCEVTVQGGSVARCDLAVQRAMYELAVRVVDERGFGLEGALVTVHPSGTAQPVAQVSRADGTLAVRELPEPPYTLDVALRNYLPVRALRVESVHRELRVALSPSSTLRGQVIDVLGRPVRGAFVSTDEGEATADSDASGNFELAGVAPGVLVTWARHPRAGQGTSAEVRARPGDILEGVRIVLDGRYVPSSDDERARTDRDSRAPDTSSARTLPTSSASAAAAPAKGSDYTLEQQGPSVVVGDVAAGGVASRAGMRAGDVLLSIDREPVYAVAQARGMLRDPADTLASVRVSRSGRTLSLRWKRPALGTKITTR